MKGKPVNILIDAHMVGEHEGGNETYIVNLLNALKALGGDEHYWVSTAHPRELAAKVDLGGNMQPVNVSSNPLVRLLRDLPGAVRKTNADLLHITYMPPPLPLPVPFVSTVHDVIYARHPEWFSARDRLILKIGVRDSVRRAAAIFTVSQHARREILSFYPEVDPAKVHAVYNSSNEALPGLNHGRRTFYAQHHLGVNTPYLLAVGSLHPRKNMGRLIEAFAMLKKNAAIPHKLLLVGRAHWKHSELQTKARDLMVEQDILFTGYLEDADLADLYRGTDVFIYPSLFEGFGIPILEAMSCGTPVVTSNTSSIPEVAGDAALMVDPENTAEIAGAIQTILKDSGLATKLKSKGFERVKEFSWSASASCIRDVYFGALPKRRGKSGIVPGRSINVET